MLESDESEDVDALELSLASAASFLELEAADSPVFAGARKHAVQMSRPSTLLVRSI